MVAPAALHRDLLIARAHTGVRPSPAGQLVTAAYAESGDLARHLRRLRRELAERRDIVIETCTAAGLPVRGDAAGAHLRIPLPDRRRERTVATELAAAGINAARLTTHHVDRPRTHGLSLGFGGPSRDDLQEAVEALVAIAAGQGARPADAH